MAARLIMAAIFFEGYPRQHYFNVLVVTTGVCYYAVIFFFITLPLMEPASHFFSIQLSAEGAAAIKKLARLAKWLMFIGCLFFLLNTLGMGLRYYRTMHYDTSDNLFLFLQLNVFPFYELVIMVLGVWQLIYYIQFTV